MKNKALWSCAVVMAAFLILGALFYPIAGDSLHFITEKTETVSPKTPLGDFATDDTLEQTFVCEYDTVSKITLMPYIPATEDLSDLHVYFELLDAETDAVVYQTVLNAADMTEGEEFTIPITDADGKLSALSDTKDRIFTLRLTAMDGVKGAAIGFYYGNIVSTGRFDIPVEIEKSEALLYNNKELKQNGELCSLYLTVEGVSYHWVGQYYWLLYAGAALLLALYLIRVLYCYKNGKSNIALDVVNSIYKYNFLMRQLVSRDFKTKYKRSVLGMLWSFLNPLLTMSIQYVVFSTIFKSSIPNFFIYLLCGIICFNFFSEATTMCLSSIVGNATLINKVYVPKYIYPFSRTLSSGINLLLSLIPLAIMLLLTNTPLRPAALLLPFALLMLFMLAYGVGLILATMMVFFRDTQFLWGIFSMLLSYLTPLFYPESIIPAQFMPIYKLNPLYHVIRFVRTILMDGVSPEPQAYLYCFLICFIPFLVGICVFRKNQDKFILNI